LVREALANEEGAGRSLDIETVLDADDDDKTYAAMGVAKTLATVSPLHDLTMTSLHLLIARSGCIICRLFPRDPCPSPGSHHSHRDLHFGEKDARYDSPKDHYVDLTACPDLFDNMYDLVDVLTFKMHTIAPNMWSVFELTYNLFKTDAVDFLDGV
jgi:hypothetical protein